MENMPENWKQPVFIILAVLIVGGLTAGGFYFSSQIQKNITKNSFQKPPPTQQVLRKVNKLAKTGEFLIADPTPTSQQTTRKTEQQVIIEGTYNSTTGKIDLQDAYVSNSTNPFDSTLIPPSIPWIMVETIINNKTVYKARFPLASQQDKQLIPLYIKLPYEKSFLLKISNQAGKLLLSKQVNL